MKKVYPCPTGTYLTEVGPRFIALDQGVWYIFQNYFHEDKEGHEGVSTATLGDPRGYQTLQDAERALAGR